MNGDVSKRLQDTRSSAKFLEAKALARKCTYKVEEPETISKATFTKRGDRQEEYDSTGEKTTEKNAPETPRLSPEREKVTLDGDHVRARCCYPTEEVRATGSIPVHLGRHSHDFEARRLQAHGQAVSGTRKCGSPMPATRCAASSVDHTVESAPFGFLTSKRSLILPDTRTRLPLRDGLPHICRSGAAGLQPGGRPPVLGIHSTPDTRRAELPQPRAADCAEERGRADGPDDLVAHVDVQLANGEPRTSADKTHRGERARANILAPGVDTAVESKPPIQVQTLSRDTSSALPRYSVITERTG